MPRKVTNPIDKHVGSRVRMRRRMLDMSQTKVADALGITFQQVQKYENGTNRIGASRLQHISQILGVPPEFFFENAPSQRKQLHGKQAPFVDYVTDFLTMAEGIALIKAFTRLPSAKLRRNVVALVKEIAARSS